jgi:Ca2+-binding EF-hand superfamily protein
MTYNKKILFATGLGLVGLVAAAAAFAVSFPGKPGRYAGFDLNGDAAISLTEIREVGQRRFDVFDIDGNGEISGAEIPLMLRWTDPHMSGSSEPVPRRGNRPSTPLDPNNYAEQGAEPGLVQSLQMDFDGDGAIQGAEFVAGFTAPFALRDIDGDGTISDDEMRSGGFNRGERRGKGH